MKTYRAIKKQLVAVWAGQVEVQEGDLVNFAGDPGDGWEEVRDGGNKRTQERDLAKHRVSVGDDQTGL